MWMERHSHLPMVAKLQEDVSRLPTIRGTLLTLASVSAFSVSAQQPSAKPQVLSNAVVNEPVQFDNSPPLRDLMRQAAPQPSGAYLVHSPLRPKVTRPLMIKV